jgi:hypothetical protein
LKNVRMDGWSTVTFYVFLAELVLLGILLRGAFTKSDPAIAAEPDGLAASLAASSPRDMTLGDDVIMDISSRYNEAVVANIDAIDTALVAILALPVGFAVFAVDKINDLTPVHESVAILFLLASCLAGFVGYAWGFLLRRGAFGMQDGIEPRRFLADYAERGSLAVAQAIRTVNTVGDQNAAIRHVKRIFALAALIYFFIGAATIAVGRLNGNFHVAGLAGEETALPVSAMAGDRGAEVVR